MKHIKHTLVLFLLILATTAIAQETATYNVTAGNLSSALEGTSLKDINNIKLTGTLNAADFFFIRDNIKDIKSIDMSEAKIEACEIDGTLYAANEIPANAFYVPYASTGMTRLNTFYFPTTIESIGENAFFQAIVLRTTNMGELPSLKTIKSAAISRCTRLRNIEIPASVEEIGAAAFAYNPQLDGVVIAKGSQLSILGDNAFNGCAILSTLDFSDTKLIEVGAQAFNACTQLNNVLLPSTVESIGDEAFMYTAISNIDWSHLHKLGTIEGSMFYETTSLKSVTLPHSVEEIKASAFANCTALTTISLPYNLTAIGDWTFANCRALRSITCPSPIVPTLGYQAFQQVNTANVEVTVLESILPQYESDVVWSTFILKGNPFTNIDATEQHALQLRRTSNGIEATAATTIKTITLYNYSGHILNKLYINDTQATIELCGNTHCIMHIGYSNGSSEVIKL